jgi:hypothetical protein
MCPRTATYVSSYCWSVSSSRSDNMSEEFARGGVFEIAYTAPKRTRSVEGGEVSTSKERAFHDALSRRGSEEREVFEIAYTPSPKTTFQGGLVSVADSQAAGFLFHFLFFILYSLIKEATITFLMRDGDPFATDCVCWGGGGLSAGGGWCRGGLVWVRVWVGRWVCGCGCGCGCGCTCVCICFCVCVCGRALVGVCVGVCICACVCVCV